MKLLKPIIRPECDKYWECICFVIDETQIYATATYIEGHKQDIIINKLCNHAQMVNLMTSINEILNETDKKKPLQRL